MYFIKNICCWVSCILFCYLSQAQVVDNSQKKQPFTVTGSINTSANFYSSNEQDSFQTRPSYSWNIYGSLRANVNRFYFPLSFVITDYDKNNAAPYVQIGISPTYKWARLHLGTRNMHFSPLIYDGQSFTGAGVELNPKSFRFAAFYGRLNKAVSDTIQVPRYLRRAYGIKVGLGSTSNFVDLIYFHAKDDSNSVSLPKNSTNNDSLANSLSPKENAVFGSAFRLTFFKKLVLNGDVAVSGLTQNLSADSLDLDSSYQYQKLTNFVSNFITVNVSSFASFAGQSTLSFASRNFNTSVNYRRVQPGFISLGTPYTVADVELISWLAGVSAAKGKLNLSTGISQQHNNLNNKLNNELQTRTANAAINAMVSIHLNVNVNYSGYYLKQKEGVEPITDSARIQQGFSQFNIAPTYNFTKGNKLHFISGSLNVSSLNDKNLITSPHTSSDNLSASINYTLGLIRQSRNFSFNGLYSRYNQDTSMYNSYGANVGASMSFLKERNLNLQGSLGYFLNRYSTPTAQTYTNNVSYSLNAGYAARHHIVNFFINYIYSPPKTINDEINKTFQSAVSSKNLTGSISYIYRF